MAYTFEVYSETRSGTYAGEDWLWDDVLTIEETAADDKNITIKATRKTRGVNINIPESTITFTCDSKSVSKTFPFIATRGYDYYWYSNEDTYSFPVSWVGKTVSFTSSGHSISGSFKFDGYGKFTLTITADAKNPVTVKRTSSPKASAGTGNLANNAAVYSGDVLSVTFTPSAGYKGQVKLNNVVIQSGATHTVSANVAVVSTAEPMATVHVWNASTKTWDLYLVYVRGTSSWDLHQVNVYDGKAWQKYY